MKFNLTNFHMHSIGSDGELTPEEIVKESIKVRIKYLCFTDHFKRPNETTWFGKYGDAHFHNKNYIKDIEKLKNKYSKKIEIFYGVELDWLEGYENWIKDTIKKNKFDFVIGSLHVMKMGGKWFPIDSSSEEWLELARAIGGIKNLIKEYYKQIKLMIRTRMFDCVGHLDYIKLFNRNFDLFSEKDREYKKEISEVLKEVKKAKMCIELNTAGWRVVGEQYPSEWILKKMKKLRIPITIGTDGHEAVAQGLKKAFSLAKKTGYKSVTIFKNRKRIDIRLKE